MVVEGEEEERRKGTFLIWIFSEGPGWNQKITGPRFGSRDFVQNSISLASCV
jgi:hypothetical protein